MVTRAYLTDIRTGIVVDDTVGGLWLVSTGSALLPDPGELKLRAERDHQIPREHGSPRLLKITLSWGDGLSAEVKNPTVVGGDRGAAAVPLTFPASLPGTLRATDGPVIVELGADPTLQLGDTIAVAVMRPDGALLYWGRVASDPDYGGRPGAVALGVSLGAADAGSPVYRFDGNEAVFCGLAEPMDATTALLVSPRALCAVVADSSE